MKLIYTGKTKNVNGLLNAGSVPVVGAAGFPIGNTPMRRAV